MMTDDQGFSQRIRTRRIELGMSQRDLSKAADISPPQLSRYESGLATPRADIASRIAKALNVHLAWLINGTGEKLAVPQGLPLQPMQMMQQSMQAMQQSMPVMQPSMQAMQQGMPPGMQQSIPALADVADCPCMRHDLTISLSNKTYRKLIELAFYHGRSLPEEASFLLSKIIYEAHIELANEQMIYQNGEMLKKLSNISNGDELAQEILNSLREYQAQAAEREKSFKEYRELSKKHLEMYAAFTSKLDRMVKDKEKNRDNF